MKKTAKILSVILALALMLSLAPCAAFAADILDSGTCGDNLTWTLTDDGTLTVSGTGEMTTYKGAFDAIVDKVKVVVFEEGITKIHGDDDHSISTPPRISPFKGMSGVTVYLPKTITELTIGFETDEVSTIYVNETFENWNVEYKAKYIGYCPRCTWIFKSENGEYDTEHPYKGGYRDGGDKKYFLRPDDNAGISYTFNDDGTLTLSGTGEVWETIYYHGVYDQESPFPAKKIADKVKRVVVNEGITAIRADTRPGASFGTIFDNMTALEEIYLPSTLKTFAVRNGMFTNRQLTVYCNSRFADFDIKFELEQLENLTAGGTRYAGLYQTKWIFLGDDGKYDADSKYSPLPSSPYTIGLLSTKCKDNAEFTTDGKTVTVSGEGRLSEINVGWIGEAVENLIIDEGITEIGSLVFNTSHTTLLKNVYIANSVEKISEEAFYKQYSKLEPRLVKNDDITIYAESGSYAEKYAKEYEIDFVALDSGEKEITVSVNGNEVIFDQAPIIENGRTLVPLRAIFEALGAEVYWDQNEQKVTAEKDGTVIELVIGSNVMIVDDEEAELDIAAKLVNERTMVPARAVAEAFGCEVTWDNENRAVIIEE